LCCRFSKQAFKSIPVIRVHGIQCITWLGML
jgi:hypothetical protein